MLFILKLLFVLQIPTDIPNPDNNKPLDFSDPFEIIVFIVLPILVILLYIFWKRHKRKDK